MTDAPKNPAVVPSWLSSLEELAHELSNTNGMISNYLVMASKMGGEEAEARIRVATSLSIRSTEILKRLMQEIYDLQITLRLPPKQQDVRNDLPRMRR
jgi:predicted patatin/cPLA2 family phospholipase